MFAHFIYSFSLVTITLSSTWNYDYSDTDYGPFYWSELYGTCGGDTQSPINIDRYTPSNGFSYFEDELSALGITKNDTTKTFLSEWDWNGEFLHHFKAKNDGHSIKLTPVDAQGTSLNGKHNTIAKLTNMFASLDDSPSHFCLDSLHFHWGEYNTEGSEHTQYNKQYPAEIHFLHYSCDFDNVSIAYEEHLDKTDSHVFAAVSFLFEIVCCLRGVNI